MYDIVADIVTPEIIEFIERGDVMCPMRCGHFDCAMSVEVAEHILPDKSETLIDNITEAAQRMIFFTAARPGQRGTGHINLRPRDEWIRMFQERGWSEVAEEVAKTREIWGTILDRKQHYLIRNLIIFSR